MRELSRVYKDYLSRLADSLHSGEIIRRIPGWICENTYIRGEKFSFKDHEYQIEIAQDQSQEMDVMKCSQVGMTELEVRWTLALLIISGSKTGIYVLPHSLMAKMFTKERFDTVIETSPTIKDSVKTGTDSSMMKQFQQSFLHIRGAESTRAAISIPAQLLIIDEYDFCNQRVLGMYSSRTRHALDEAIKKRFSTPTVSNFGINKRYNASSKKRYFVRCCHCSTEQAPDFRKQVVIPGFSKDFMEFNKDDLLNEKYEIDRAYLRCIRCGKELDTSLADKERRKWVAEFPSRTNAGYGVKPFDLIKYNSTPSVIRQISDYSTDQDYWNFVHGEPHDTDQNQINDKTVERCCTGEFAEVADGCYVGIDIGKVCHYFVIKPMLSKIHVVAFGKIRLSDGDQSAQLIDLLETRYRFIRAVPDHGPDLNIPKNLQDKFGPICVHPAVYVKGRKDKTEWIDLEDNGYVNISRTKGMDVFVQSVNKGEWIFPRVIDMEEVRRHFKQMVRVEQMDDNGDMVATWEKSTEVDHYFHAAFYAFTGMMMDEHTISPADTVAPIGISGISIGSARRAQDRQKEGSVVGFTNFASILGRIR